jgi:hypothetical protein
MHINEIEKLNWPTIIKNVKIHIVQGSIPVYCKIFTNDRVSPVIKMSIREVDPNESFTCHHGHGHGKDHHVHAPEDQRFDSQHSDDSEDAKIREKDQMKRIALKKEAVRIK